MRPISLLNEGEKNSKWSSAWLKNVGNYFTHKKKIVITDFNLGYAEFPKLPLHR